MTIAHAFNYRVAELRDGVRSAIRIGRSRKAETCFMGTTSDSDVSDSVDYDSRGASLRKLDARIEGGVTKHTSIQ